MPRQADALVAMAERFLATGEHAARSGDHHLVTVHVDAEVLAGDAEGRCELEDGPALAAETARRLSCDAAVVAVVEDERGTPLDVGRKTRSIPPAIRRALQVRDRGCRFPGCTNRRFLDGDHIRHWAAGGETSLANLALLCRRITGPCTRVATPPKPPQTRITPCASAVPTEPCSPISRTYRPLRTGRSSTRTAASGSTSTTTPPCPPGPANGSTSTSVWTLCSVRTVAADGADELLVAGHGRRLTVLGPGHGP